MKKRSIINQINYQHTYYIKLFINKIRKLKTSDSKEYWKLLNSKTKDIVEPPLEQLQEHFKILSENKENGNGDTFDPDVENVYDNTLLNSRITKDEIKIACKRLKKTT